MARPLTLAEVMVGFAVLAASVATVTVALLSFVADRETAGVAFAAGGGYLTVWAAIRLCIPPTG